MDLTKNVETRVKLNKFEFRDYQKPFVRAIERQKYKRALIAWPRRGGKDMVCLQIALRQALRKTCTIYYIFPSYSNARKAVWQAITIDGLRVLDYFPDFLCNKNTTEMKITFKNNSVIQFLGSMEFDRLRGTNPYMVIFSEYAYQNPQAYAVVRPILAANNGVAIFISTVWGKNHFYDLYQLAENSSDWYCEVKTVDQTQHISQDNLLKEKEQMSDDMFMQEYYNSFDIGVRGAYYSKYINELRLNHQITDVPCHRNFPVHTAWDIGYTDSTSIIFFQTIGASIHIIDFYENSKLGLEHYIKYLDTKPYKYGKHIAPHDMANASFSTGMTRLDTAHNMGIDFIIAPKLSILDGIEAVRSLLPRCYFEEHKCSDLINKLNMYHQEWDEKRQDYKNRPAHGFESHAADAMRMLATAINRVKDSVSPEELERRYRRAIYGQTDLPEPFN